MKEKIAQFVCDRCAMIKYEIMACVSSNFASLRIDVQNRSDNDPIHIGV